MPLSPYVKQSWANFDPTKPLSDSRMIHLEGQYDAAMADAAVLYGRDVRPWAPSTVYAAGQAVLAPTGDVVTSATAHTSGASYSGLVSAGGNWNLSATFAPATTSVPKWQPNTAYSAGQQVVSPNGDVVAAVSSFTTGSSYNAANWTLSATFVQKSSASLNVKDYGAVGDGVTDDGPAIRAAVTAAAGKALFFPPATYYYKATGSRSLAANTSLVGVRGASIINFDAATAGTYTEFARNGGDNITLENLVINRVSDFPAVLIPWQAYAGFTIRGCVFNGNRDLYTTNYCHGIQTGVQNAGTSSGLLVTGSTFQKLSFALFQTNASTATVKGMTFRDCIFTNNYATDLEFNSPNGTMSQVVVDACTFQSNQTTTSGAGFGVGLAFVKQAVVRSCAFTGYNNEAIHIEDSSSRVNVDGNKLTSCGLMFGSYVQIISGANAVTITNNHIDGTANTNFPAVINCLAGGTGLTPGGRNVTAPTDITITGNHINAGGLNGIYLEVILRPAVMNNRIRGAGSFNSGTLVYGGGNGGWGIDIYDGTQATVSGNEISGFAQAFRVHSNTISSGGAGFNISGNNIQSCGYGIALVNTGSGVIGSNMVYQCERPLVTGTGNLAAQPVVVSGNHAFGCTFPMEVGGKVVVRASGAASIGSGVTLAVQALALALPNGTAITFTGGGVLTLTSAASAGATSLVGNLATANVASGATAVVTGLAHSTVSAQNHITLSANGDSVAGTY